MFFVSRNNWFNKNLHGPVRSSFAFFPKNTTLSVDHIAAPYCAYIGNAAFIRRQVSGFYYVHIRHVPSSIPLACKAQIWHCCATLRRLRILDITCRMFDFCYVCRYVIMSPNTMQYIHFRSSAFFFSNFLVGRLYIELLLKRDFK